MRIRYDVHLTTWDCGRKGYGWRKAPCAEGRAQSRSRPDRLGGRVDAVLEVLL